MTGVVRPLMVGARNCSCGRAITFGQLESQVERRQSVVVGVLGLEWARSGRTGSRGVRREAQRLHVSVRVAQADVAERTMTEEVVVEIDLSEVARVVLGHSELVAGIREVSQRPVAPLVQAVAIEADD